MTGDIETSMKQILLNIAELSDFNIEVMESDKDHIHLEKTRRTTTSHILERKYILDGWIFVASVGNVSQETIKRYIENQG